MTESKIRLGLRLRDVAIAYLLLRILIGVNYFNHGFTRISNVPGFVEDTVKTLADSYFPEFLVRLNSYLVPPVELIVGILITIGLATRGALIATFILMIILKLGVTSIQNWQAATSMLSYGLVLFILLAGAGFNIYSIDHWLNRRRAVEDGENRTGQGMFSFASTLWSKRRRRKPLPTSINYR
ncbi:MAG: DoxX family protein [Leptolyngbyaceae cyanobacterium HOT.MB2.61]|jgi:DoxX.|nr:DoxX family protein [Leptolyngbyaceae cyanobacterium HOT.MB2.61]